MPSRPARRCFQSTAPFATAPTRKVASELLRVEGTSIGISIAVTERGTEVSVRGDSRLLGVDQTQVVRVIDYLLEAARHHSPPPSGEGVGRRVRAVMEQFHAHECALANRVLEFLRDKGARIIGPETAEPGKRAATIAFVPERGTPEGVMQHLAKRRIAIGGGADFYARRLVEAVGIDPERGVARGSLVHYNSAADVDRLLEALAEVI